MDGVLLGTDVRTGRGNVQMSLPLQPSPGPGGLRPCDQRPSLCIGIELFL